MSRVSECLKQILSARYGKDVRQSIHDGIKEIDSVARTAQSSATANAQTAAAKASEALTASQEALQKAQEAQESAQQAKVYAENAEAVTGVNIGTKDRAGIVKGGENHIAEDGTLELVVKTTETTMQNSRKGGLEVDEIGGVCEQESTTGKNLWSYGDIPSGSVSSISWDIPAGTYTFSTATSTLDLTLRVYFGDGTSKVISLAKSPTTFTLEKDVVSFNYNSIKESSVTQIQVEEGTVATSFEPYTGGSPAPSPDYPQEIKKTVVSGILTHKNQLAKEINVRDIKDRYAAVLYIEADLKPNTTYTISFKGAIGNAYYCNEWLFIEQKNIEVVDGINTMTVTTRAGDLSSQHFEDGYSIFKNLIAQSKTPTFEKFMLVEGNTAKPYEPYTESVITLSQPIELYGTGDVQDVIEDGKNKKRIERVSVNALTDFVSNYSYGRVSLEDNILASTDWSNLYRNATSNMFAKVNSVNSMRSNTTLEGFALMGTDTKACWLLIRISGIEQTLEAYNAFLAKTPFEVVFERATEKVTDLPLADQIALNSLKTFEGVTYLEFDSEVQPTFAGKYGASLVGGIALEAYNKAHTHSRTVLWTNSDKTQPIEAGTVLLPLSLEAYEQYEFFLVTYCNSTASEFAEKQVLMARAAGTYNGNNVILSAVIKEGETYHQHERNLAYSFNSQAFTVAYCTYLDASFKPQYAHDKLIPYQIIGIR